MKINAFRSALYLTAKLLGDLNAILRGRIIRRTGYRIAGKFAGRGLRRLFR